MPVTKHKAASCRKFNVVAPRGRDKRGESFSRLSTVANFVARLARKSSLRDCKRKIQVDSAGVGKSAAGQIHVEATWRVAKPLKSTKSKILFFFFFPFFPFFSFPLSFSQKVYLLRMHPDLSLSLKNLIRHALFRFLSFRFASTSYSMAYFHFSLKLSSHKGRSREGKNTISKVFQDLGFRR